MYTERWFDLFLRPIRAEQTAREVAFLYRWLPQPRYTALVDLCCGNGRHAHLLAAERYSVTGIDREPSVIAEARRHALPNERYLEGDMRQLPHLYLHPDAVLCLWQSFGYFDTDGNRAVLRDVAEMLPAGGRFILDIYHHDFFVTHQGTRTFERGGVTITETTSVAQDRLHVTLHETDQTLIDTFEWELFTPDACVTAARSVGLHCTLQCTGYDEQQAPSSASPRVQYVFEK